MALFLLTVLVLVLSFVYEYVNESAVVATLIVIVIGVICTCCEMLLSL